MGFVAVFVVFTAVFALFNLTPDYYLDQLIAGELWMDFRENPQEYIQEIRQEYLAERGLDKPAWELYVDWMVNMFTLDWGESFRTGEAVFPTVMSAVTTSGTYVVPAVVIASVLGTGAGLGLAMWRQLNRETLARVAVYLGFGLPTFWLGATLLTLFAPLGFSFQFRSTFLNPMERPLFYRTILPAVITALPLLGAIASYSRAYSLEVLTSPAIKLVRSKGGGSIAVARHVLKNVAIPLCSVIFTEMLTLLAISVVVIEAVFRIDGIGLLIYNGIWNRDLPILLGVTLTIAVIAVATNILQDVSYSWLDPRVDTGTRF